MPSGNSSAQRFVLKWLCVTLLSAGLIYLCYQHTLASPGTLKWSVWAFSDWLINYSGGFVRRGLAGYLIRLFSRGQSAIAVVNMLVFANFTTMIFLTSLLLMISRRVGAFAAVLFLLIPGGVWSMQFTNSFYYRKEILFFAYIALICVIYKLARRMIGGAPLYPLDILNCGVIALCSVVMSFVHESFLFIGALPSMMVLYWIASRNWPEWRIRVPMIYALAMVGLFLVFMVYKGGQHHAQTIWLSLNPADRSLISKNGEIGGGISSIGWASTRELGETLLVVLKGTAWYYLFALAVSIVYILATVGLFCTDGPNERGAANRCVWTTKIYSLCLAAVAPLFVLAADWGRWIVAVNMMAIPLICAGEFSETFPYPKLDVRVIWRAASARYVALACGLFLILAALTFRIPECCLVGSGDGFTTLESRIVISLTQLLGSK